MLEGKRAALKAMAESDVTGSEGSTHCIELEVNSIDPVDGDIALTETPAVSFLLCPENSAFDDER